MSKQEQAGASLEEQVREQCRGKDGAQLYEMMRGLEFIAMQYHIIGIQEQVDVVLKAKQSVERAFVIWHMDYNFPTRITGSEWERAVRLADGFGLWSEELEDYFKGGFDWSHIRDSSPEAFERMSRCFIPRYM